MSSAFTVELTQQDDYRFAACFDQPAIPTLLTDEPAPLGRGAGPNPVQLLAVAIANCLASSLLFALRKFRNEPGPLRAVAHMRLARNAENRWRVGLVQVDLHLGVPAAGLKQLGRALAQFEEFCVVTQSVRAAFPVDVHVFDSLGAALRTSTAPAVLHDAATLGAA
jgi:organic hydroperoxide reductase OsmC/OhrA